jgi:predicted glycoside hydrolase/deacetylase ChbG (UPF0249 family)
MQADAARGLLIVNADDWGRDVRTTNSILDCVVPGGVSAVSAMVFMEDSERAAALGREHGIDAGLHLNLTTTFSAARLPVRLRERQQAIGRYLRRHRLAPYVFNPAIARACAYVVDAQLDEFQRLYGMPPARIDGHHHMHLCANVLAGRLLPARTLVRRNFCFEPGEKGRVNRAYRRCIDGILSRRHRLTDLFFSLEPIEPRTRLDHIWSFARTAVVEVETHPALVPEYQFLRSGEILRSGVRVGAPPAFLAAS